MGTATVDQPESTDQATTLLIRQVLLLVACLPLTLAPYVAPEQMIEAIPRFAIVLYYIVVSLVTSCLSIMWLWQLARIVLSADSGRAHRDT